MAEVVDRLGLQLDESRGWSDPVDQWTGQYHVLEGSGPDIEIRSTGQGLASKIGELTVPLLPEPDGTWLLEGANAWLAPGRAERTLTFDGIGFAPRLYAQG